MALSMSLLLARGPYRWKFQYHVRILAIFESPCLVQDDADEPKEVDFKEFLAVVASQKMVVTEDSDTREAFLAMGGNVNSPNAHAFGLLSH